MALAERIKHPPEIPIHGKPCSVGHLLATLEGAEREAFIAMLGTPDNWGWTQDQIYEAVTAEGYHVARQTINIHRGGRCRCPKPA